MDYLKISKKSKHVDKRLEKERIQKNHISIDNRNIPVGVSHIKKVYAMVTLAITSVTVVRYHCVVNTQSARNKEGVINKNEKRICQKNDNTARSFSHARS